MADDAELLRRYALNRSQDAFAELVSRHLDFVYAVAYRRVGGDAQLAQEVSQSVFLALAAKAAALADRPVLTGWLHTAARFEAIQSVRREQRRLQREQTAHSMLELNRDSAFADDWHRLRPVIDDAIGELNDRDREAVLMRFFEERPFSEIGARLRITEDGARLRLDRALDKLSVLLAKRGVTSTAAALSVALAQQTGVAAPAGLGAAIASAAAALSSAAGPAAIYGTAKTIAMTTTQKILVAATLAIALGTGLYEARVISRQNAELQALRDNSERELRSLRAERDDRARQLAAALQQLEAERAKVANALASSDPAMESALDSWLHNVTLLKQLLEKMPDKKIPELQFATAQDWLDAARDVKTDSDLDVRRALSTLRRLAKNRLISPLSTAFKRYLDANNNQPPSDATQLAPYFEAPIDPAILQRYGAIPPEQNKGFPVEIGGNEKWILWEKAPVDDYYDTSIFFGTHGGVGLRNVSKFGDEVNAAIKAFQSANPGQRPTDPAQIAPYLHSSIDPAFVLQKLSGNSSIAPAFLQQKLSGK